MICVICYIRGSNYLFEGKACLNVLVVACAAWMLGGCCHHRKVWEQAVLKQAIRDIEGGITQFRWDYPHDEEPGERFWVRSDTNFWREVYPSGRSKTFRVLTNSVLVTVPWPTSPRGKEGPYWAQIVELASIDGRPVHATPGSELQVMFPKRPSRNFPRLMMRTGPAGTWEYLGEMRDWRTAVAGPELKR